MVVSLVYGGKNIFGCVFAVRTRSGSVVYSYAEDIRVVAGVTLNVNLNDLQGFRLCPSFLINPGIFLTLKVCSHHTGRVQRTLRIANTGM
jgi:hypothetical protein